MLFSIGMVLEIIGERQYKMLLGFFNTGKTNFGMHLAS